MDSEADKHDAIDVDFMDEHYYINMNSENNDDDDGYEFDNNSDDDNGYGYEFDNDCSSNKHQQNYIVLKEEDIRQSQADGIAKISTLLSVSRDIACTLLRRYNWDINTVQEQWFGDEEKVRKAVGLSEKSTALRTVVRELACGICFDEYPIDSIKSVACGHPFCSTCWTTYISTSINDGMGCLTLKCPSPSCCAIVGIDMVHSLASDQDKERYHRYLLRSYVEDGKKTIKWCPAPYCECAVEYEYEYDDGRSGSYDVSCTCSYGFCWNCKEEAHSSVDCDTVAKWKLRTRGECENKNWILANTKPCPKCKRPIEKNQGCMHMRCTPPCRFQFCWVCCGDWSVHGQQTGGFYACNRHHYETENQERAYDDEQREMANLNSSERYTNYYNRFAKHQLSSHKAMEDLYQIRTVHLGKLSEKQFVPEAQLSFIIEAWLQIVECRRVLKWTYVYGYYLSEEERGKRELFEYMQEEAEVILERLHQCAEKEVQMFLVYKAFLEDFNNFRAKLVGLTSVARNYFENLVRALENGLSDVNSQVTTTIENTSSNNSAGQEGRGRTWRTIQAIGRVIISALTTSCQM